MTRGVVIFWALLAGLLVLDTASSGHPRVEPAPFALGSGKMPTGGHCSGK